MFKLLETGRIKASQREREHDFLIKLTIIVGDILGKNQNESRTKKYEGCGQKNVCGHYCRCNLVQDTRQLSQQDSSMLKK